MILLKACFSRYLAFLLFLSLTVKGDARKNFSKFAYLLNIKNKTNIEKSLGEARVTVACDTANGLTYHACDQTRSCQPTCENYHDDTCAPDASGTCLSGCLCEHGKVLHQGVCIEPAQCRDCMCTGSGDVHYRTFDQSYYDFQGNCSYVASRVRKCRETFIYQVLVTNIECGSHVTCTHAVTILYDKHIIHMERARNDITTTIDGIMISNLPLINSWFILQSTSQYQVTVYIPKIQLEVTFSFWYQFTIKLSKFLHGVKTEGLCGNCNDDKSDDFQKRDGIITNVANDFAFSWLVEQMPLGLSSGENCQVLTVDTTCIPGGDDDNCDLLLDTSFLGACSGVVDAAPYVAQCKFDVCHGGQEFICDAISAYMDECRSRGICENWRTPDLCPFDCPTEMPYQACGRACGNPTCAREFNCPLHFAEGCFCPADKVLLNGKCVYYDECKDCVCTGFGDVHYINYDGINLFDFQGECTYLASKTKFEQFQVYVTNIKCKGVSVSCTLAVTVLYGNHIIIMQRAGSSLVSPADLSNLQILTSVDGISITNFPLDISWVSIESDGINYATVVLKDLLDLEVSLFDGTWGSFVISLSLEVTLDGDDPLEGLCGNCNGNSRDDYMKPDYTWTTDINEFGASWLVPQTDVPTGINYSCVDPGPPPPPTPCSPVPANQDPCLLIMDTTKFGRCHLVIDPKTYVTACQFDMCHVPTSSNCSAVENYAMACLRAGICIDWRNNTFCPYHCPSPLLYNPCGSGCQVTCDNYLDYKNNPQFCKAGDKEGCYCPSDQVLSEDQCVNTEECKDCVCTGIGDVHYKNYDGTGFYDFQGECTYVASTSGTDSFRVYVTNKKCGGSVSCTLAVTVIYDEHRIVMQRAGSSVSAPGDISNLKISTSFDGIPITVFPLNINWVSIHSDGVNYATVILKNLYNLEVSLFDGNWGAFVIKAASELLVNNVFQGLCGNCNKNPNDDFKKKDNSMTTDVNEFALSWLVPQADVPTEINFVCVDPNPPPLPTPCPQVTADIDSCLWIMDKTKFGECHLRVDPTPYVTACQFDMCHVPTSSKCSAVRDYAMACLRAGICIDWRNNTFCPYHCPSPMLYKACGSGCQVTCQNYHEYKNDPEHFCKAGDKEGCYCPEGTVLKNGDCVHPKHCKDCICSGWGDPHYTNYYGTNFDFQGRCSYFASQDIISSPGSTHVFQILVTNEPCSAGSSSVSCTTGLTIFAENRVISIKRALTATTITTKVDGVTITIYPHTVPSFAVIEGSSNQFVTVYLINLNIEVSYYSSFNEYSLQFVIKVPSELYANQLEGLCGNCILNGSIDPMINTISNNLENIFGLNWFVTSQNAPAGFIIEPGCENVVQVDRLTTCLDGRSIFYMRPGCELIGDTSLFGECGTVVNPGPYIDTCNYDMCFYDDQTSIRCNALEVYARVCLSKGICVNWRDRARCPYNCIVPPNIGDPTMFATKYKPCADACSLSCDNYSTFNTTKCNLELQEGCFCDNNLILTRLGTCSNDYMSYCLEARKEKN